MLKMLGSNILIRRVEAKDKEGSILIPEVAKEQPAEGVVLDVGSDCYFKLEKGNTVVFGKYAGTEVVDGTEVLIILRERDILGIRVEEGNA